MMKEYAFADIHAGLSEILTIDVSKGQVDAFMALSGDSSPVHTDDEYARSRGYEQRLVHGVLIASYISQLIGMQLPGKHGVLRTLACNFHRPCYVPARLTLTGTIKKTVPSVRLVQMDIEVRDGAGTVLVTAKAESVMKL